MLNQDQDENFDTKKLEIKNFKKVLLFSEGRTTLSSSLNDSIKSVVERFSGKLFMGPTHQFLVLDRAEHFFFHFYLFVCLHLIVFNRSWFLIGWINNVPNEQWNVVFPILNNKYERSVYFQSDWS